MFYLHNNKIKSTKKKDWLKKDIQVEILFLKRNHIFESTLLKFAFLMKVLWDFVQGEAITGPNWPVVTSLEVLELKRKYGSELFLLYESAY
jgi:hypothetical protein